MASDFTQLKYFSKYSIREFKQHFFVYKLIGNLNFYGEIIDSLEKILHLIRQYIFRNTH